MSTTPDATVPTAIVRPACEDDRRFIVETTAKVRQPRGVTWLEWEPYGFAWANRWSAVTSIRSWVVESDGVVLAFLLTSLVHGTDVEMLYVKQAFRGLGYGQLLLDAAGFGDEVPCRAPTESWRRWCTRRGIKYQVVT